MGVKAIEKKFGLKRCYAWVCNLVHHSKMRLPYAPMKWFCLTVFGCILVTLMPFMVLWLFTVLPWYAIPLLVFGSSIGWGMLGAYKDYHETLHK